MKIVVFFRYKLKYVLLLTLLLSGINLSAQCPPNIDFEEGTFNNWLAWIGNVSVQAGKNTITWTPSFPVPPVQTPPTRHLMLNSNPGNGVDEYGFFPKNCPNGSGNSIKIGNDGVGAQAEGVSYTFTIPASQNTFNLTYFYAMVLHEGNGHLPNTQARLNILVENLTNPTQVPCQIDPFIVGTSLPGFLLSSTPPPPGASSGPIYYKPWAAASIKLDGYAGQTMRVFFQTADCTQSGHFGYAYVDIAGQCNSSFIGAAYCPDDTSINVTAPFGFETYQWWDITDPTVILATTQTINFTPPPPSGMTLQVALTPYNGYGCADTLTVQLLDTLNVFANAGPDELSCQNAPVQLGINPTPGFVYSWSPVTGLSDPNISNPIATPSVTTEYVLTVRNGGGGCLTTDTVLVKAAVLDNSLVITGPIAGCLVDPTILTVLPADSIQWYRNGVAIPGANQTQYNVIVGGSYHATLFSFTGCSLSTNVQVITVYPTPVAGFNTNTLDQCFNAHQFVFTNTSSIAAGTMQYNWDLGDGTTATTTDVTHSYATPGTYIVKLFVTSDSGCVDSINFTVNVFESPVAGFTVSTNELCFANNQFVFTDTSSISSGNLQYRWNMGDGNFITSRNVTHSYALPGTYTVQLLVLSDLGCIDTASYDVTVNPTPVAGFSVANPQQCFGNNQFNFINTSTIFSGTMLYAWDLGDGTTATTRDVIHSYTQPGDYVIKMVVTSDKGCADSSTFNVKVLSYAVADFFAGSTICMNLRLPLTNKTLNTSGTPLNYLWDFGNGQTSTQINPVYSYPAPGNYTITLTVNSNLCPQTFSVKQQNVVIDAPATAIRYADVIAVMNFEEQLQARQIGTSVLWTPATGLDNPASYRPVFKGLNDQLYEIRLKTATGCITVDTQLVKIRKKIEIYVPTAFTPDGNALNEYLRPVLMGFRSMNYFRVYDRWGKLLFQTQNDRPGWDGRVRGVVQEMQTVVWMVEAVDVDGNVHKKQGTSILLR